MMYSLFCRLLLTSLLLVVGQLQAQSTGNVSISEIMANNVSTILDEDGEYSDWIEVKNTDSVDIDLGGWYLSDDLENPIKWLLPSAILKPGQFLLVFASGKDRRSNELHTNFRLSTLGEKLILVQPDGITVQSALDFPTQYPDVSYGILNGQLTYLNQPTPGAENVAGDYLDPPVFSDDHGFYDQPFTLVIQCRDNDAIVRYTTDGSIPSETNGTDYLIPIQIDSTTVLRAVAIRSGNASLITTATYIFPAAVVKQPAIINGYPTQWGPYSALEGNAPADYEMDPEISMSPEYKDLMEPALKSIPTIAISAKVGHLFSHSTDPDSGGIYIYTNPPTGGPGEDWERSVSLEYLLPNGDQGFQINCGLRIHGGHSRLAEKSPKKSFRLVFDDEFGAEGLKYPLFANSSRKIFNTLILRAGFNQTWIHWNDDERIVAQYINDSWAKDMHRKMGHLSAHNNFVHLYINGLYWGLYNLSERMDDEFMEYYFGGDRNEYDIIKDYAEVAEGNIQDWNELMVQAERGFIDPEQYYAIQGKDPFGEDDPSTKALLDVDNLIDYMILNFYMGNKDWDHHNWVAFRNRVEPGSGFQFAPWDSERTFNGINLRIVEENNENRPSYLYSQLRKQTLFRKRFTDRANELLGSEGYLGPDSAKKVWMDRAAEIDLAIIAESARWGDYRRDMHQHKNGPYLLYTKNNYWLTEQQRLLNDYFPQRSKILLEQLAEIGLAGDLVTSSAEEGFTASHSSFPNPFSSFTTIYVNNAAFLDITMDVFDGKGIFIRQLDPSSQIGDIAEFTWHPGGLQDGLYFYRINTQDRIITGKLLYAK